MNIYQPYTEVPESGDGRFAPRKEQTEAIADTFRSFKGLKDKAGNPRGGEYLWNAKMRFGKTVSALWLIEKMHQELGLKKVLIVTHRPVVNASWYEDFLKVFKNDLSSYSYGTSKETADEGLKNFDEIKSDADKGKCVIFFASMQFLHLSKAVGGVGKGQEELKQEILDYDWDLVIIDEAHEGTKTNLGANVISYLKKGATKILHLSGTPFNLLESFTSGQIYNWDYIKEQQAKRDWTPTTEEQYNPYITLPQMNILTFQMEEMTDEAVGLNPATGEFSFSEFFRVKEGQNYPKEERGKFLHEPQVIQFINTLCQKSETSHYPFSRDEYRKAFRHTFWVVPGVKEAAALKELIESGRTKFPRMFKVINVAGENEERSDALDIVRQTIGIQKNPNTGEEIDDSDRTATITLSCGRLTTGVTVRPWTAVLYLKGSDTTSASTYMQTIFRVQSPHVLNGRMKSMCYVFDFAPERALTMMAETAKYSRAFDEKEKKSKKKQKSMQYQDDKDKMKALIDVLPIIETSGGAPVIANGKMEPINVDRLFGKLNEVYINKVVTNGFDHPALYNNDSLDNPSDEDLELLEKAAQIGREKPSKNKDGNRTTVNTQTEEQKKRLEEIAKARKKAREEAEKKEKEKLEKMSEEERERYLRDKEEKAARAIRIRQNRAKLEGLSKRIPLLMYGADIKNINDCVTIEMFCDPNFIDERSWNEFMPPEISREGFKHLAKFYNPDIFRDAGMRIRELAQEADSMDIEDRIQRIAEIFKFFKNPDKETVLTPWEVVNRHMSETIGGYCFFAEDFKSPNTEIVDHNGVKEEVPTNMPRFIPQGDLTKEIFGDNQVGNIDYQEGHIRSRILEINSKTGLYPLYLAYSLYRQLKPVWASTYDDPEHLSVSEQQAIWDDVVKNNIYVICNTPMAVRITERTLLGFREGVKVHEKCNVKHLKLIENAKDDQNGLIKELKSVRFWTGTTSKDEMKFNAIVSNPPYQESSNTNNRQNPIYHLFYDIAGEISDIYTFISPARFLFNAGLTPAPWNIKMLGDRHLRVIEYIPDSTICFPNIDIKGGVTITLWDKKKTFNPIGKFIPNEKLRAIASKFVDDPQNNLSCIIFGGRSDLKFNDEFLKKYPSSPHDRLSFIQLKRPSVTELGPNEEYELKSSTFDALPYVFLENIKDIKREYYHLLGLANSKRAWRYIPIEYMTPRYPDNNNITKFKVFVPKANGNGQFGETLSKLEIGLPYDSATATFISVGAFETQTEALNCLNYLKTKFVRCLLGILKITQDNPPSVWAYIPLQDFSNDSDINWDKTISEIDEQLYDKYDLSPEERDFIESKVKPMD